MFFKGIDFKKAVEKATTCPHCGEKISIWKKSYEANMKFKCGHCGKSMILPKWVMTFNLLTIIMLVILTMNFSYNRALALIVGVVFIAICYFFSKFLIPVEAAKD